MRSIFTPRKVDLRPALAASMAATLAISGTAAVSIGAPVAAYAQATDEAPERVDKDKNVPKVGLEGTGKTNIPWFLYGEPRYPDYVWGQKGDTVEIDKPEYWEYYAEGGPKKLQAPSGITFSKGSVLDNKNEPLDLSWVTVHPDGRITADLSKLPDQVVNGNAPGFYPIPVEARKGELGEPFKFYAGLYVTDNPDLEENKIPELVRYEPKFPSHPIVIKPGGKYYIDRVAWSDTFRPKSNPDWPKVDDKEVTLKLEKQESIMADAKNAREFLAREGNEVVIDDYSIRIEVAKTEDKLDYVEIPVTFDYKSGQWDTAYFKFYINDPSQSEKFFPVSSDGIQTSVVKEGRTKVPTLLDANSQTATIDDAEFFVSDVDDPDTGVNNRDWVQIERSKTGELEIVARPNGNEKLINDDPHQIPIQIKFPDGSVSPAFDIPVTVTKATTVTVDDTVKVSPDGEKQPTGITINNTTGSTTVEATDAKGDKVDATVDDNGTVHLTPKKGTTGEITVTINDDTLDGPLTTKVKVEKASDLYTPEAQSLTVKTGETPDSDHAIKNLSTLPKGTTTKFKGAVDTSSVGTKKVTVEVTYPDGSTAEVTTDLTVERRTDAEVNDPTVDENFEIIAGSKLRQEHAEKIIENIGSLPSGTTADFKDKGEGSLSTENPTPNDIDKDVTIVVTYPDGSTEEIDTKITIKPRPDNWDFQPQVREKVITAGDKLEARDVIENLHELPKDIEVELDGDVDTSTPGAYNPQVVVTYPDGSQDRVGSTVIVNPKPLTNKQFDPNYGDTVKLTAGESKSAENPFGDETAPEGTKYEAKFRSDANDWTFDEDKANETGVVTAQAPSARDLAQEFARVTKYTHLDWDTLAAVLKPMVTTSVEVDIDYADGSFDAATAAFELVDADGHSLLDPEADADGDGHTNRDEVEKRSNPFDEESVPVPPADWNTSNANTVYPGEDVTVPNNGGRVQVGTTVKVDGPGTAEINKDGDLVITANEDAKPGDKIVATMTDSDGNQIDIVQVSVKEDERLQGDKTNATFGSDPYVLIPGESKDTNRPFGPFGIPDDTEITVQVPADATDWKFEGNEDGTVTAQAPSAAQLAAQFSALDKATQKDWDKLAEALAPVVAPTVGVNFTFTDGSNDFANARFELTDANDKSILDPDADFDDDGRTNKQEVDTGTNPFERNYFEPHWDATEGEGSAEPGGKLTIPNKGGKIPKGAIVDVAGPGDAVIDDRGNLVVAVEEQAIPGDEITATVKDEQGAEIQRIVIIVNAKVNSNTHTAVGEPGKDTSLSSNIDQGKCSAAAIGFGLPMLAIVPLAIATQAAIPGLAGFREQVAVQIEQVNSQIQNGLGIMNPQIAKQVSDINGQLRQYGTNVATIGGGLLLFAAGIGVTALIVDSCKPGGPTSSN